MSDTDESWSRHRIAARSRIVSDNDYCGDPDGVAQLAHQLLCASVDVRLIVSSPVAEHHPVWNELCTLRGAEICAEIAALANRSEVPILATSATPMAAPDEPADGPATRALIEEAMRDDTDLPLFVTCAGGLTTVASAWVIEPRIAERITVVWNGGERYSWTPEQLAGDVRYRETNVNTDPVASRVVFDSDIPLWQVPQDVFEQAVVSRSEAKLRIRRHGPLGRYVYDAIGARVDAWSQGLAMGETYHVGDQPLVLLTSLGSAYGNEPCSSRWIERPRPRLDDDLLYVDDPSGAPMRVFTRLDVRLMLEDFYAKLELHASGDD